MESARLYGKLNMFLNWTKRVNYGYLIYNVVLLSVSERTFRAILYVRNEKHDGDHSIWLYHCQIVLKLIWVCGHRKLESVVTHQSSTDQHWKKNFEKTNMKWKHMVQR